MCESLTKHDNLLQYIDLYESEVNLDWQALLDLDMNANVMPCVSISDVQVYSLNLDSLDISPE